MPRDSNHPPATPGPADLAPTPGAALAAISEAEARDRLAALIGEARDLARLLDYAEVAFLLETTALSLPRAGEAPPVEALADGDFTALDRQRAQQREEEQAEAFLARFGLVRKP